MAITRITTGNFRLIEQLTGQVTRILKLAVMTVGQLNILDGVAGVTDTSGEVRLIEAVADAVLCGPCALVRWRRVVDVGVGGISATGMRRLFKKLRS